MGLVVTVRSLLESPIEREVVDWAGARALLEGLVPPPTPGWPNPSTPASHWPLTMKRTVTLHTVDYYSILTARSMHSVFSDWGISDET